MSRELIAFYVYIDNVAWSRENPRTLRRDSGLVVLYYSLAATVGVYMRAMPPRGAQAQRAPPYGGIAADYIFLHRSSID